MGEERLQKIIAEAGICSRREAEKRIAAGRVFLNGKKVTRPGTKADLSKDRITVDKKPLRAKSENVYFLFYKPKNVMVTRSDPEGRPTIYDYLKKIRERIYPVGRLDFESEGLLLLTNDGDLTHRLTHPASKVPKVYEVRSQGTPTEEQLQKLRGGVTIDSGKTLPAAVRLFKKTDKTCWIRITITEWKNRQIRNMMEAIGLRVLKLRRTAIGPYKLGNLKPGRIKETRKQRLSSGQT